MTKSKVLLHTCCAICFSHPYNKLVKEGYEVIPYFYNPNIYPLEEQQRRLDELIKIAPQNILFEKCSQEDFYKVSKGLENEPEKGKRCLKCFELRLKKTAQKAVELGIPNITTTLTVSPHKVSRDIFEVGEKISKEYGLNFLKYDFKKEDGFKITVQIAREKNLYMQSYCGCEYSLRRT